MEPPEHIVAVFTQAKPMPFSFRTSQKEMLHEIIKRYDEVLQENIKKVLITSAPCGIGKSDVIMATMLHTLSKKESNGLSVIFVNNDCVRRQTIKLMNKILPKNRNGDTPQMLAWNVDHVKDSDKTPVLNFGLLQHWLRKSPSLRPNAVVVMTYHKADELKALLEDPQRPVNLVSVIFDEFHGIRGCRATSETWSPACSDLAKMAKHPTMAFTATPKKQHEITLFNVPCEYVVDISKAVAEERGEIARQVKHVISYSCNQRALDFMSGVEVAGIARDLAQHCKRDCNEKFKEQLYQVINTMAACLMNTFKCKSEGLPLLHNENKDFRQSCPMMTSVIMRTVTNAHALQMCQISEAIRDLQNLGLLVGLRIGQHEDELFKTEEFLQWAFSPAKTWEFIFDKKELKEKLHKHPDNFSLDDAVHFTFVFGVAYFAVGTDWPRLDAVVLCCSGMRDAFYEQLTSRAQRWVKDYKRAYHVIQYEGPAILDDIGDINHGVLLKRSKSAFIGEPSEEESAPFLYDDHPVRPFYDAALQLILGGEEPTIDSVFDIVHSPEREDVAFRAYVLSCIEEAKKQGNVQRPPKRRRMYEDDIAAPDVAVVAPAALLPDPRKGNFMVATWYKREDEWRLLALVRDPARMFDPPHLLHVTTQRDEPTLATTSAALSAHMQQPECHWKWRGGKLRPPKLPSKDARIFLKIKEPTRNRFIYFETAPERHSSVVAITLQGDAMYTISYMQGAKNVFLHSGASGEGYYQFHGSDSSNYRRHPIFLVPVE